MSILTAAIHERLADDATLAALLAEYKGEPAIFTSDPAPGDSGLPYIVTAGEVAQAPFDTKTSRGRSLIRDVRCYADASGSAAEIEAIAERVRALLHRQEITISGYTWLISDCGGPIAADERDFYGRILTLSVKAMEHLDEPEDDLYLQRVLGIQPANIIQALALGEASGELAVDSAPSSNDGRYFGGAGLTYRQPGPSSDLYSILFNGNDTGVDMVNQTGNTFGSDWDGNKFTAIVWAKMNDAAQWLDASTYRWLWHVRAANTLFYTTMGKGQTNHQLEWRRRTGGAITSQTYTYNPAGTLGWFCMGMGFDLTGGAGGGPRLDFYLWDTISGFIKLTGSESANLTDWGSNPPTGGTSTLFAGSLTLQEHIGWGSLAVTWMVKLSDADMQNAMTP